MSSPPIDFSKLVSIARQSDTFIDVNKFESEMGKLITTIYNNLDIKTSVSFEKVLMAYADIILMLDTIEDNVEKSGYEIDLVRESITSWIANKINHTCIK